MKIIRRQYTLTPDKVEESKAKMLEGLDRLDREIRGDPSRYLVGESLSIADIAAASLFGPLVGAENSPYALRPGEVVSREIAELRADEPLVVEGIDDPAGAVAVPLQCHRLPQRRAGLDGALNHRVAVLDEELCVELPGLRAGHHLSDHEPRVTELHLDLHERAVRQGEAVTFLGAECTLEEVHGPVRAAHAHSGCDGPVSLGIGRTVMSASSVVQVTAMRANFPPLSSPCRSSP
ncbi:glutathione S-transferase domain-containing protein [Archangium violaceum]|nr:glutathione S-transferase domain-containing protein [Archangium violaceum]